MADANTSAQAAIEAGKRIGDPKVSTDHGAYAVLGTGDTVKDLEFLMHAPRRIRAAVTTHDTKTFAEYFNLYKAPPSRIFANRDEFHIVGLLDYHEAGGDPAWCSHKVTYTAPRSPEWVIWTGKHGRQMSQPEFATFIENNVDDIQQPADEPTMPTGADMLEIARNLQAKKAVNFSSAIRLANGEQEFTYAEEIQGSSSKGKLKVPERFVLGIPVFLNDQPYRVEARLRYRINEGKLILWYDLFRHPQLEVDAFNKIIDVVEKDTTIQVWHGVP